MHPTDALLTIIPLWPDGAPGSEGRTKPPEGTQPPQGTGHEEEVMIWTDLKVVRNVTQPTLTAYLPDPSIANGTAVIVCPGGAFHFLSIDMEGTDVARWLNARGVAAFVLKYRLIRTGDDLLSEVRQHLDDRAKMAELMKPLRPLVVADGQQAVRVVRGRAAEWGIAADRIGIMGFSAGGTVTENTARLHDSSSRPDFAAVIYGADLAESLPVPADAPPLFVLCADDDDMAATVSARLYSEWRAAGRPVELHIYAEGGHGFGLRVQGLPSDTWIDRYSDWLRAQGLLAPADGKGRDAR